MVRCFVTSTAESESRAPQRSARAIVVDSIVLAGEKAGVELAKSADEADVVLFAETHADDAETDDAVQRILRLPEYARLRSKVVVHSGKDVPRPLIPGLYPSLSRRWSGVLGCEGAPYLAEANPFLTADVGYGGSVLRLGSFMGVCAGKPLRERLLRHAAKGTWKELVIRETGGEFIATLRRNDQEAHDALKRAFVRDILEAKFAICPRGVGPSSFRIFESMQLGRAPVIIADDWLLPPGPDWHTFAIFVPERAIARLPRILHEHEIDWQRRGLLARSAWEAYYGPKRLGPTIVRQAERVLARRQSEAVRSACAQAYVQVPRRLTLVGERLRKRVKRLVHGAS